MPLNEQETHVQFIREQLSLYNDLWKRNTLKNNYRVNNIMNNDKVVCFRKPIVPSDCPTFDEETPNYVRERLELYLKTWVLPNLNEVLNELYK